jgi:hypothetical protein
VAVPVAVRMPVLLVVLAVERRHLPDLIKQDTLQTNLQQIQVLHLLLLLMDLLVEMEEHIHQTQVLVAVVAPGVQGKQEHLPLEDTVDLVFNFPQHSKIQYHNPDQMEVV